MFTADKCPFREIDNENYVPRFGVNNADSAAQTGRLSPLQSSAAHHQAANSSGGSQQENNCSEDKDLWWYTHASGAVDPDRERERRSRNKVRNNEVIEREGEGHHRTGQHAGHNHRQSD